MKSKKRGAPSDPLQAMDAAAKKRRKADRLIGDRLTVLPSTVLLHLLLPCLTFEEQMTHVRQVSKSLHSLVEKTVLPWMNTRFSKGLALISREEKKKRKKERKERKEKMKKAKTAHSASSASSSSAFTAPPPTVAIPAASFNLADAVWVNRQLHVWQKKVYNRKVELQKGEMEVLRVPWSKVVSDFLIPRADRRTLYQTGRRVDQVVKERRMAAGFWLFDLLHHIFQQYGHVAHFLTLYDAKQARKTEMRSRQLKEWKWQMGEGRLQAAMEAEGVDWSQGTWDAEQQRWEHKELAVWVRKRGKGAWRVAMWPYTSSNPLWPLYLQASRAVSALARASRAAVDSSSDTDDSDDSDDDDDGEEDRDGEGSGARGGERRSRQVDEDDEKEEKAEA